MQFKHTKNKSTAIVGKREEFKGKDLVNLREFKTGDDDELLPTKSGFTLASEDFYAFFKKLRKFGREAGLIPKPGEEEDFEITPLDELEGSGDDGDKPKKNKKKAKASDDDGTPKKVKKEKKAKGKKKPKVDKEEVKKAKFDKKKRPHI
jgi:hypothetical protein